MPTLSLLPSRSPAHAGLAWLQTLLEAFPLDGAGSAAGLHSSRQAARLSMVETTGLPGKREEAWRFTDVSLLCQITPLPLDRSEPPPGLPAPAEGSWRVSLEDWNRRAELSWPAGIEPLSGPELESHLGQMFTATELERNWCVQLNRAIAPTILALRIRPGVNTCLELVSDAAQGSGVEPHRLLLLVEQGASLDLLQVHRSSGPNLTSVVLEARLEPRATLRHALLAQGCPSSALLAVSAVSQAAGSHYAHTSVCSDWGLVRQEPVILQSEGQATTQLRGLQWVRERQIADTHSRVRFAGPEGKLDQVHKVVAEDEGRSVFNGCIQVPRQAQRTDASQLSRSLLLSDRARIDTKPELEIVADDVRCSHGATISRLQDDELFYLRSRGIAADQASRLLLRSFCQEVVTQLPEAAGPWAPLATLLEEAD